MSRPGTAQAEGRRVQVPCLGSRFGRGQELVEGTLLITVARLTMQVGMRGPRSLRVTLQGSTKLAQDPSL